MTMEIVKSLNHVQSINLIFNQFNFKWWNHEKKYQFRKPAKEKDNNKKNKNQIWYERNQLRMKL
jgi:hypothetical protein